MLTCSLLNNSCLSNCQHWNDSGFRNSFNEIGRAPTLETLLLCMAFGAFYTSFTVNPLSFTLAEQPLPVSFNIAEWMSGSTSSNPFCLQLQFNYSHQSTAVKSKLELICCITHTVWNTAKAANSCNGHWNN